MSKNVDAFIEILNEELLVNEKLLNVSVQKTEAIKKNDMKIIMHLNDENQKCIRKVIELEKLRAAIVSHIEKEFNVKNITNIKEIVQNVDTEKMIEIETLASKLKNTLNDLRINNDLNNKLLKISLEYIEININVMTTVPLPNTYGNKAIEKDDKSNKFFDAKY